ncbi:hypothetical protein GCM10020000_80460 [Streptomyces olivoverticillatus]
MERRLLGESVGAVDRVAADVADPPGVVDVVRPAGQERVDVQGDDVPGPADQFGEQAAGQPGAGADLQDAHARFDVEEGQVPADERRVGAVDGLAPGLVVGVVLLGDSGGSLGDGGGAMAVVMGVGSLGVGTGRVPQRALAFGGTRESPR